MNSGPRRTGTWLAVCFLSAMAGGAVVPDRAAKAQYQVAGTESAVEKGKKVVFDRRKGNCMSCHLIEGATLPGNIGPPLIAIESRFPDKAKLREQIWDPTRMNPQSMMPPFGRHRIISEEEIDLVVEYLYTL